MMKLFALFGELGLKGVEETKENLKDVSNEGENTKNSLAKSFQEMGTKAGELGKSMAIGLAGIVTGAVAMVEGTRELRQDLGKLKTTFEETNQATGTATETFRTLYGVIGESDTSIEAANHLAMMTNNEKDLAQWTDILTGVYATFGDSLPLEGLSEAANETMRVGQVTGPLADALNWAGVSEEEFNEKLLECTSTQEREKLIRETLNGLYGEASDTYKEINGDVIANNEAQADLNLKMAEMSEKLQPLITEGKIFLMEVLEKLTPVITWIIDNISILAPIILGFLGTLFALNIASKIQAFIPIIKTLNATMSANPIGAIITIIGLLVTAFITLWNNCEGFREFWIGLWDKLKTIVSGAIDGIKKFFSGMIDFVKNNWKSILTFLVNPFAGAFKLLYDNCDGFRNFIDNFISKIKNGVKNGFNAVVNGIKNALEKAKNIVKGIIDKIKGFFDFEFKLPKIKTPKFSIKPSGWKLGDLLDGVIPKLGITWYAQAVRNPMILDEPTAFGISKNGNLRVGGEAGSEVVAGTNTLMNMISDAVVSSNAGSQEILQAVLDLLYSYLPVLAQLQVRLDTGELVGALVGPMDEALGELAFKKGRGY